MRKLDVKIGINEIKFIIGLDMNLEQRAPLPMELKHIDSTLTRMFRVHRRMNYNMLTVFCVRIGRIAINFLEKVHQ